MPLIDFSRMSDAAAVAMAATSTHQQQPSPGFDFSSNSIFNFPNLGVGTSVVLTFGAKSLNLLSAVAQTTEAALKTSLTLSMCLQDQNKV